MTLGDVRETSHGAPETADDGHLPEARAHAALAARAQAAAAEPGRLPSPSMPPSSTEPVFW